MCSGWSCAWDYLLSISPGIRLTPPKGSKSLVQPSRGARSGAFRLWGGAAWYPLRVPGSGDPSPLTVIGFLACTVNRGYAKAPLRGRSTSNPSPSLLFKYPSGGLGGGNEPPSKLRICSAGRRKATVSAERLWSLRLCRSPLLHSSAVALLLCLYVFRFVLRDSGKLARD